MNWRVYAKCKTAAKSSIVISALHARSNFGRLLNRVDKESRSLVIEKRGTPRAILLSIRDYVRLAAPEPEVLRAIGEESGARHRLPFFAAELTASSKRRAQKSWSETKR